MPICADIGTLTEKWGMFPKKGVKMFETIMLIINDFLFNYGYLSLFISAFVAASLVMFSPEVLIALMFKTHNFWLIIFVATAGSYFGSLTTYLFGYWGVHKISNRFEIISPEKYEKGLQQFKKYGAWLLLFTSVPVIGDVFPFVAGAVRYDFKRFTILVLIGKFVRFTLVLLLCHLGYDITTNFIF
ncbi:MAG: DedA family protein [Methanimicrococcus sp.]|nr:DedA family protein [Methanimicrococcus sp.]